MKIEKLFAKKDKNMKKHIKIGVAALVCIMALVGLSAASIHESHAASDDSPINYVGDDSGATYDISPGGGGLKLIPL